MHHLYRVLRDEAEALGAIRHDVVVHHEEGEKGALGFRAVLSTEDERVHGNVRVWNAPDDSLFLVLNAHRPRCDWELVIRVDRPVSRDVYTFDFRESNAFGVGSGDLGRGNLLDVLLAKVGARMNRVVSEPGQGKRVAKRAQFLNG
jgi:hypothetical protein